MRTLKFCLFSLSLLVFFSCSSTKTTSDDSQAASEQVEKKKKTPRPSKYANAQSLAEVFRTVSGIRVVGNGNVSEVQVMGISTSGTPLFVLNGVPSGVSFSELNGMISPAEIVRVKVLRNPSELSMYGLRGAAGVIEITLK